VVYNECNREVLIGGEEDNVAYEHHMAEFSEQFTIIKLTRPQKERYMPRKYRIDDWRRDVFEGEEDVTVSSVLMKEKFIIQRDTENPAILRV